VTTATQIGGSVGTAVLDSVAMSATAAYLASHAAAQHEQQTARQAATLHQAALVHGYATAIAWAAGLLAVTAVGVFVLIHDSTNTDTDTTRENR
jgi:hypothetical protein